MGLIPIHTDHGEIRKSIIAIAGFCIEILCTHFLPITGDNFDVTIKFSFVFITIHLIDD
jgi:hypothetical protein